jgi:hypothetical protein
VKTATLTRLVSGPDGTRGELVTDCGWRCVTVERPPTGEHPCQQPDSYLCHFAPHPREGERYQLEDKHGRTAILIHPANVWEQLLGCIALGDAFAEFAAGGIHPVGSEKYPAGMPTHRMLGVRNSVATVHAFEAVMRLEPFVLTIK